MSEPKPEPTRRLPRWLHISLVVFAWLFMFGWVNIPPYRGNILEEKHGFFVWKWQLYSRAGENICDVRYFDMNKDREPIKRWELLGYDRPGKMPDHLARTHKKQLVTEYKRVCAEMKKAGDPKPHVVVEARCARKGAWKTVEHARRNVCTMGQKKKKKKKQPKSRGGSR